MWTRRAQAMSVSGPEIGSSVWKTCLRQSDEAVSSMDAKGLFLGELSRRPFLSLNFAAEN